MVILCFARTIGQDKRQRLAGTMRPCNVSGKQEHGEIEKQCLAVGYKP